MAKSGKLQTALEYYAARAIIGGVGLLPLKRSVRFGEFVARILYKFLPWLRKTGYRNLEMAMPELSRGEHEKILLGCFESMGRQLGFISHFKRLSPESFQEMVDIEGREHLDNAHNAGKGVLFFTGHFGGWELFNLVPPAFGYPMNILVRRIDNERVENYVESLRSVFGSRTIDKKVSARTMFRILNSGGILGIVADLNAQEREGVFVDFFGIPASTTTGVARLAFRTNPAVIPAFAIWQHDKKKFLIKLYEPIEIPEGGDNEENIRKFTQDFTSLIEEIIRQYPDQWMWIHKRWNTRPPGEPGIY